MQYLRELNSNIEIILVNYCESTAMKIFLFSFFILLIIGCKKEDKQPTQPVEKKVVLSVESTQVFPGDAVIVKLDQRVPVSEANILLNAITVKGYANGDSSYVFIVPVIAAGTASLSIQGLPQSNPINLIIKSYTSISDPQAVINEFITKRNQSIDSVLKVVPGSNFQPSPQSLLILNQIKEEWDLQFNRLSAADKELLAYVLKRNTLDPSLFSFTQLPPGLFAKTADAGERLVTMAKNFVTVEVICLASIPPLILSGVAFVFAPNPLSALIFLGIYTTFIVTREVAIRKAEEVGRLEEVAQEITGTTAQRSDFLNNQEKSLSMEVQFRNLATGDAGINADINTAFVTEQTFVDKDKEVEAIYTKATSKTEKLKGSYPSATNKIGRYAQGNRVQFIDGEDILVKGVSDNRISYTTVLSGATRKVKISSTANVDIDFELQVAYRRSLDGKEFTKNIACVYKTNFVDTMAILRSKSWALFNGPIIMYTGNASCPGSQFLHYQLSNSTLSFNLVNGVTKAIESDNGLCGLGCPSTWVAACVPSAPITVSNIYSYASLTVSNATFEGSDPVNNSNTTYFPWILNSTPTGGAKIISINASELKIQRGGYYNNDILIYR